METKRCLDEILSAEAVHPATRLPDSFVESVVRESRGWKAALRRHRRILFWASAAALAIALLMGWEMSRDASSGPPASNLFRSDAAELVVPVQ